VTRKIPKARKHQGREIAIKKHGEITAEVCKEDQRHQIDARFHHEPTLASIIDVHIRIGAAG
jgi:hypothetical protein